MGDTQNRIGSEKGGSGGFGGSEHDQMLYLLKTATFIRYLWPGCHDTNILPVSVPSVCGPPSCSCYLVQR